MRTRTVVGLVLAVALALGPAATASVTGPVTNSGFEVPPVSSDVETALESSPADRCLGVGHQVRYGSQTPQARATGGGFGDPDPDQADPVGALLGIAQAPAAEADDQTSCAWNDQEGHDLAFVNPAAASTRPVGWSYDLRNRAVVFGYGLDDNATDREVAILANDSRSSRNLWQSFANRHQVFTPNADALSMEIEAGTISESARVQLFLTPTEADGGEADLHLDCTLTFESQQLRDALARGQAGRLQADPANASFDARNDVCSDLEAAWKDANATEQDRRDVLAQTRITELVFWTWNFGVDEPTVIDDVRLPGASLYAHETTQDATGVGSLWQSS